MPDLDDVIHLNQPLIDSTALSSSTFFSKQMNITKESLNNLFSMWRQAIHNFLNENLLHHDALVGENACHLRAAALMDFVVDHDLKKALIVISNKIHELSELLYLTEVDVHDAKGSIRDFMLKHHLIFYFPENLVEKIRFIIDSYILTLTKEEMPQTGLTLCERTSNEPIKSMGFVKSKAKSLISNTQKSLSAASCSFMINEALYLTDSALTRLLKIKYDAHQRSYLPQFVAGKVMLKRLLIKKTLLLIKIIRYCDYAKFDEIVICLKPNALCTDFDLINNIPVNSPCMVFAGSVNYQNTPESEEIYFARLLKHSFMDIFLATFASHPQYSGELKHLPPPFEEVIAELKVELEYTVKSPVPRVTQDEVKKTIIRIREEQLDYEEKKIFASKNGCTLENPSLLFFNHIYADMIDSHAHKILNKNIQNTLNVGIVSLKNAIQTTNHIRIQ